LDVGAKSENKPNQQYSISGGEEPPYLFSSSLNKGKYRLGDSDRIRCGPIFERKGKRAPYLHDAPAEGEFLGKEREASTKRENHTTERLLRRDL